jgi:hypothetical protein
MTDSRHPPAALPTLLLRALQAALSGLMALPILALLPRYLRGEGALDMASLGALLLMALLPFLAWHLFRWAALWALSTFPFLND